MSVSTKVSHLSLPQRLAYHRPKAFHKVRVKMFSLRLRPQPLINESTENKSILRLWTTRRHPRKLNRLQIKHLCLDGEAKS